MSNKCKISVLVSGGGTNLQAVIDAIEEGRLARAEIVQIISSNAAAYAIERGKNHGIKTKVINKKNCGEKGVTADLIQALREENTDLIVLAGYMSILAPEVVKEYRGRVVNIHPSLIPKFCGMGMYGMRVHEAVLAAGEKESGATVHFVDEGIDTGPIILQEAVPVLEGDTPEILAARVLKTEHKILAEALEKVVEKLKK